MYLCLLSNRVLPISTGSDTIFPYTTLCRADRGRSECEQCHQMRGQEYAGRVYGAAHRDIAACHRIERGDVGAAQRVTLRPMRPSARAAKNRLGVGEQRAPRHPGILIDRKSVV